MWRGGRSENFAINRVHADYAPPGFFSDSQPTVPAYVVTETYIGTGIGEIDRDYLIQSHDRAAAYATQYDTTPLSIREYRVRDEQPLCGNLCIWGYLGYQSICAFAAVEHKQRHWGSNIHRYETLCNLTSRWYLMIVLMHSERNCSQMVFWEEFLGQTLVEVRPFKVYGWLSRQLGTSTAQRLTKSITMSCRPCSNSAALSRSWSKCR